MTQTAKILGVAALLGVAYVGVSSLLWKPVTVTVMPQEQAVLTGVDGTLSVLEPGVRSYNAAREEVTVYDTTTQREHVVPAALTVEGCAADIGVWYNIGDVRAFHTSGGDFAVIGAVDAPLQDVLDGAAAGFGDPVTQALGAAHDHVRQDLIHGLRIIRLTADFGDCAPVPPRIAVIRETLPAVANAGTLGEERAAIAAVNLITADDVRVEGAGAVATYDIIDQAAFTSCFGTGGPAADQMIARIAGQGLRRAAGRRPMAEFAEAVTAPAQDDRVAQMRADCGTGLGAVDFSAAVFTQLTSVNCDDMPDVQACRL